MNSTPIISARIIRLTALLPPPPTPMTRISAKFSESERSGIGLSSDDPLGGQDDDGRRAQDPDAAGVRPGPWGFGAVYRRGASWRRPKLPDRSRPGRRGGAYAHRSPPKDRPQAGRRRSGNSAGQQTQSDGP